MPIGMKRSAHPNPASEERVLLRLYENDQCSLCRGKFVRRLPALEPAHAIAALPRILRDAASGTLVVVGLSGRGDKDLGHLAAPG